jgi:hypothetical protein
VKIKNVYVTSALAVPIAKGKTVFADVTAATNQKQITKINHE